MNTAQDGFARLLALAGSGELGQLCERHGVRLMTVFGSVARGTPNPRDLDVAVSFAPGRQEGFLDLLEELVAVTGTERIDLMNLDRAGPVARERGLVGAVPLYEARPGDYARAQMAAITMRMETEPLRRLDLELMAG